MRIPSVITLPPNRVWRSYIGGRTLDLMEGIKEPSDSHFPEDWIASTTRALNKGREHIALEGLSCVRINGNTWQLKLLIDQNPEMMVGLDHYCRFGSNTPFLLKYLDTANRLLLQARPTIPFARKHLGSDSGKTKAYVILDSRLGEEAPYIYLGFQRPPSREEFERAVKRQDIELMLSWFDRIPVEPGDVFLVPGGFPHAIGPGVFMIEIMEPTDFVVRLEFGPSACARSEELNFMGRDVSFASDMIDFKARSIDQIRSDYFFLPRVVDTQNGGEESLLIGRDATDCFSVNRLRVNGRFQRKSDTFYVGTVTKGSGRVSTGDEAVDIKFGDRFLVPYATGSVEFEATKDMEIVLAFNTTCQKV